jgi:hypothetical protein
VTGAVETEAGPQRAEASLLLGELYYNSSGSDNEEV